MIETANCAFCGSSMAMAESNYLASGRVCEACYCGGFLQAGEALGVRIQEMRFAYRVGSNVAYHAENEVIAALAYDLGFEAVFAKEGIFSKLLANRDEIQTGDAIFDKAVLIKTDKRERTEKLLEDELVRGAIADLVPLALDGVCVEGNRCRLYATEGSATMPDTFEAKRLLALLFCRLARLAEAEGLPKCPELLGLPCIDTLTKHYGRSGKVLESVRFHETTFDNLEVLRPLEGLFEKSLSAKLSLVNCTVNTDDFAPTEHLDSLPNTTVSFEE